MYFVQADGSGIDMKTVSISELRANLLRYLTAVRAGETICVTSKGLALATLVPPADPREEAELKLRRLAEGADVGDVVSPIDEEWEAGR